MKQIDVSSTRRNVLYYKSFFYQIRNFNVDFM